MNGVRGCGYLFQHLMLASQPLPQQLLAPFIRVSKCSLNYTIDFLSSRFLYVSIHTKLKCRFNGLFLIKVKLETCVGHCMFWRGREEIFHMIIIKLWFWFCFLCSILKWPQMVNWIYIYVNCTVIVLVVKFVSLQNCPKIFISCVFPYVIILRIRQTLWSEQTQLWKSSCFLKRGCRLHKDYVFDDWLLRFHISEVLDLNFSWRLAVWIGFYWFSQPRTLIPSNRPLLLCSISYCLTPCNQCSWKYVVNLNLPAKNRVTGWCMIGHLCCCWQ